MPNAPLLCLASASPRRRELLDQIGVAYSVAPVDIDERRRPGESARRYVTRLALEKARAGLERSAGLPVLGADTVVVADDHIMGKPRDRSDAIAMLQRLSGGTHRVLSAVAICGAGEAVRVNSSRVTFRTLAEAECRAYWDSGEPADKAGAYAIQGLAAVFIERLAGSYSGVMGLPLYETAELLRECGIIDVVMSQGMERP